MMLSAGLSSILNASRLRPLRTFPSTKLLKGRIRNSSSNSSTTTTASPERAFKERLQEIQNACPDPYPRLAPDSRSVSCSEFRSRYSHLVDNQTVEEDSVVVHGRPALPCDL